MKSRIDRWAKYRTRIGAAPDWTFSSKKKKSSRHALDSSVLEGKGLSSKAIATQADSKGGRLIGLDAYDQKRKTLLIAKLSLFGLAMIIMVVWYVLWVR